MADAHKTVKNRILQVGVELEGGWVKVPQGLRAENIIRDGSVKFGAAAATRNPARSLGDAILAADRQAQVAVPDMVVPKYIGEIPSPALGMDEFEGWMTRCYPQLVNETCGLHAHMSFRYKLNYMRLMDPKFTPHMVKGLLRWAEEEKLAKSHPIWNRLRKSDHEHCAHIYLGDNQVKVDRKDFHSRGKPHSRYTAINYCWAQHKTVEVRLLPMMETPDQGVRAVSEIFRLTNQFLARMRQKEVRAEARIALSPATDSHYRIRV